MFILLNTNLRHKEGFTLIEVLIVIILIGLIFSILSMIFYSNISNSLNFISRSEKLKREANFFWNIQRKIASAKEIQLDKNNIYMFTTAGDYYEGMVKSAYIFRDGNLFYYEFPYPYGDLKFYEEDKLNNLGKVKNFRIMAFKKERQYEEFKGMPDYFMIEYDERKIIVKSSIK